MEQSFGSSCHGAGRRMSRTKARHEISADELRARLRGLGIIVEAGSSKGLVEEAPEAYKDIDESSTSSRAPGSRRRSRDSGRWR